ncbi:MAG: hypothetical protein M3505_00250, partial [Verrucomicrobiota bacterium]|nr:hypothetical protein [Verrucomicrobiota bacterium]
MRERTHSPEVFPFEQISTEFLRVLTDLSHFPRREKLGQLLIATLADLLPQVAIRNLFPEMAQCL